MPERRTMVVLGALVLGMTLTSGLLLLLEPGPTAPFAAVSLQSVDPRQPLDERLSSPVPPRDWRAIVIHDSGGLTGSASTLDQAHRRAGRGGLGYDFVIDNGRGGDNGRVEVGDRWRRQAPGAYVRGEGAAWFNQHAVGVCLVGDADRASFTRPQLRKLVNLVQRLQKNFDLPPDSVYVDVGGDGPHAASHFPNAWFREQLLDRRLP